MDKAQKQLSMQKRAERVLISQGRAAGLLGSFPQNVQESLAELCHVSGALAPGTRESAAKILSDYWESQKAVVDEPVTADVLRESRDDLVKLAGDWKPDDEAAYKTTGNEET